MSKIRSDIICEATSLIVLNYPEICFFLWFEMLSFLLKFGIQAHIRQAYIRMDCKGVNPVSTPGVGGNCLKKDCSKIIKVSGINVS